jgi:predicted methyltransferase
MEIIVLRIKHMNNCSEEDKEDKNRLIEGHVYKMVRKVMDYNKKSD